MQQIRIDGTIEINRQTRAMRAADRERAKHESQNAVTYENPNCGHYQVIQASPEETAFRHAHWKEKREAVIETMQRTYASPTQLDAFVNCGGGVTVEWSATEKRYRLRGSYCHSRHCEPCMKGKAATLAKNLKAAITDRDDAQFRFVTLTLKHTRTPLADQIKRLYASFRKLRATKIWKATQDGGAAILEVKWKRESRMWHPHLHVIAEGRFVDKRDLVFEWSKITGDSFIIDIRVIHDAQEASYYLGKYVKKGTTDDVWSDKSASAEWLLATKGVRTAATYGTWRGIKLLAKPKDAGEWKPIASLLAVHRAAANGEEWAVGIMINLMPSADPEEVRSRYLMDTGDG